MNLADKTSMAPDGASQIPRVIGLEALSCQRTGDDDDG